MKNKLTVKNFTTKLNEALSKRFIPINADARAQEASNTLRSLIGENAWDHGLISERDIATLYAVIDERKRRIPANEDRDGHDNQLWLAQLVKETGLKFDMREYDFENPKMINKAAMNLLLSAEPVPIMRSTNYDAIVGRYAGPKGGLVNPDLLPDVNPLVMKKKQEPKPREKPEPRTAKSLTSKEPSTRAFENRWDALQVEAQAQEMDSDGITCFIADGQKQALALTPEAFREKCATAKRVMKQVGVDSPKAEKLVDEIAAAHEAYHAKRELGGVSKAGN